ncbi:hypothetical protein EBR66_08010 [bacterium]|nr:hypothetical protein [bacterium]
MAVVITANSTNAETLQFGLYDSAGNRLVSTGNATLYTTAGGSTTTNTTTAGVKYAALPGSGYQLVAGYEYYAAFSYTYTSGTGITFTQAANVGNANAFQLFGTTVGTFDAAAQATSTLPSTMASATVSTIQPTFALLTT